MQQILYLNLSTTYNLTSRADKSLAFELFIDGTRVLDAF